MATPDKLFCTEFRQMMNERNMHLKSDPRFHLVELPMPDLGKMFSVNIGRSLGKIVGVKEPYFSKLNGSMVTILKRGTYRKRQVDSFGKFIKDSKGNLVYTQVPVPRESVAVLSSVSIGLKNSVVEHGVKKKYQPSKGFKYVDYIVRDGKKSFIYIIPREMVYRLNTCALALSQNSMRNYYKGYKLALQNGSYVYMYVIPTYKYRSQSNYRVLGVKAGIDFSQEVITILNLWQSLGVIFDLEKTSVGGGLNLGIITLEGTLYAEDYKPLGNSMKVEKDEDEDLI